MARKSDSKAARAARVAAAETISLDNFLSEVTEMHKSTEETGACLIKNPHAGGSYCIETTRDACKSLKGKWIGGPCGG